MAKRRHKPTNRTPRRRLKNRVWYWCAKYIKLRDATNRKEGWGYCCTCKKVIQLKGNDAGHFISRGSGGGSGVYFDERNIHLQCHTCNGFEEGNKVEYNKFMLERYGQKTIDDLERLHKTHNYTLMELEGLKLYYKQAYMELKR